MTAAIDISNISKSFTAGRLALDDVSLTIETGEMVALIGASGSGKSTLLRHCAGLTAASSGRIAIHGEAIQANGKIARNIRTLRGGVGVIFQQFNLVGRLSVMTNVLVGHIGRVPMWRSLLTWFTTTERREALDALISVGIGQCAFQRASTLSGGQQQRAAIARALTQRARVILADEPIASLDPESARRVMDILSEINRRQGMTVVVSLHQVDIALRYCPRFIALKDGKVRYDGPSSAVTAELLRQIYGTDSDLDFQGLEQPREPSRVPGRLVGIEAALA